MYNPYNTVTLKTVFTANHWTGTGKMEPSYNQAQTNFEENYTHTHKLNPIKLKLGLWTSFIQKTEYVYSKAPRSQKG